MKPVLLFPAGGRARPIKERHFSGGWRPDAVGDEEYPERKVGEKEEGAYDLYSGSEDSAYDD